MSGLLHLMASAPGTAATAAALLCGRLTGLPAWPALARSRMGSTVAISVGIGGVVFVAVQRLTAPAAA